jgi:hypothetical protein
MKRTAATVFNDQDKRAKRLRCLVEAEKRIKVESAALRWSIFRDFAAIRGHVQAVDKWIKLLTSGQAADTSKKQRGDCIGCYETTRMYIVTESLPTYLNEIVGDYVGKLEDLREHQPWADHCHSASEIVPEKAALWIIYNSAELDRGRELKIVLQEELLCHPRYWTANVLLRTTLCGPCLSIRLTLLRAAFQQHQKFWINPYLGHYQTLHRMCNDWERAVSLVPSNL